MRRFLAVLIAAAVPALCADDSMLVSTLVKHWKIAKTYTIALAEMMPEDGYASKPNPAEMTFAAQMEHIADANAFFFSRITDGKSPLASPRRMTRRRSSRCSTTRSITRFNPWRLSLRRNSTGSIELEGGKMSGLEAVMLAMDHTAHHRGQCIVYLRVKNIAPPEYQF